MLDHTFKQGCAIHLYVAQVEACLRLDFFIAESVAHGWILQDAGVFLRLEPPSGDGGNAVLIVPHSNAVPGLLQKAEACTFALRAALHVDFSFTEVFAEEFLLGLLGSTLREVPWKNATPFLRLGVVEDVAER